MTQETKLARARAKKYSLDLSRYYRKPSTQVSLSIVLSVFIGAVTRHFLKKVPIPFTALLLLFGIILGTLSRLGAFELWGSIDVRFIRESFYSAAHLDPHLLLYLLNYSNSKTD